MEDKAMDKPALVLDRQYLQDHDVIQRYIRHGLSADELQAFEILLIADPGFIEEIENQRVINAVFRQELTRQPVPAVLARQSRSWAQLLLPIAATLVLGLFIGLKTLNSTRDTSAPVVSLAPVVLEAQRGTVQPASVALSEVAGVTLSSTRVRLPLRIDVGPQAGVQQHFRLQILDSANQSVLASVDSLAASSQGWLEYPLELPVSQRGLIQVQVTDAGSQDQQSFLINLH